MNALLTTLLLAVIRAYQLTLSPLLGNVCRYTPSCSRYGAACIASHGPWRGSWLALRRVLRCHPFTAGGYDPPPPASERAPGGAEHVRAAPPVPARPESSCHTECRAHGCSR